MKHLLSIEKLDTTELERILAETARMKRERGVDGEQPLRGQTWAMMFSKSSTRTRVSFEVGIRELGGSALFLAANETQQGRGEPIKDTARVLGRMVKGAIIRTYAQSEVEEFAQYSGIPTINALTDEEHPCQVLTDLFTFQEKRGSIRGKTVAYLGDGAANVALSWGFAAARAGFELRIAAPAGFQPAPGLVARFGAKVALTTDVRAAVTGADLIYTDVWISMGKEAESKDRIEQMRPYQVNRQVVGWARPGALVMHCLPAYRGKEIDEETFEANAGTIFDQAENRLHTQKAILKLLAR